MSIVNLNHISKEFSEKIYNNNEDEILSQLLISIQYLYNEEFQDLANNQNNNQYYIIKLFKSLLAYCADKNIDLNKYFTLSV